MAALQTIGRVECLNFIDGAVNDVVAKVDTGAYRSSVWASNIHRRGNTLSFELLGPESDYYSGVAITTKEFKIVQVENSFGHKQSRYSVFLHIEVGGKKVRSNFTLANRATKTYPVLLGRKLLKHRFIVDVAQGKPLSDEETHGDESLE